MPWCQLFGVGQFLVSRVCAWVPPSVDTNLVFILGAFPEAANSIIPRVVFSTAPSSAQLQLFVIKNPDVGLCCPRVAFVFPCINGIVLDV